MISSRPALAAALAAGLLATGQAPCTAAATRGIAVPRAERIEHVRRALGELLLPSGFTEDLRGGPPEAYAGLAITLSSGRAAGPMPWDDVEVPFGLAGRDVIFDEAFLIAFRHDDHLRAARQWLGWHARGLAPDRDWPERPARGFSFGAAWDHGPVGVVRAGHWSLRAGGDGWRLGWARGLAHRPGFVVRFEVGERDGERVAGFSIGRSLFDARRAR